MQSLPNTDQQYWLDSANQCFMLPIRICGHQSGQNGMISLINQTVLGALDFLLFRIRNIVYTEQTQAKECRKDACLAGASVA